MLLSTQYNEELLTPINDDMPCGVYLKNDKSAFRPLRNEFNVAQTSLRKLSQNPSSDDLERLLEENHQNWLTLSQSLHRCFVDTTRDIELIGWFLVSQMLLDNTLNSTANTLEWLTELVEHQWVSLNPVLADSKLKSDTEQAKITEQTQVKVKAFFQISGDSEQSSLLYAPLLLMPLVDNVTFFDYQSAEQKGTVNELKQLVAGSIAHERNHIVDKLANISRCLESVENLRKKTLIYSQEARVTAPNFGFVKNLFTKFDNALQQLTNVKHTAKKPVTPTEEMASMELSLEAHDMNKDVSHMANSTSIQTVTEQTPIVRGTNNLSETAERNRINRDLAFHQLRELSDYFRQSEPHSPISFLLEKAIRWGYLSLPELLQEMMEEQDGNSLSKIFNAAGLDHLDQVLLPDIDVPITAIKKLSVPTMVEPIAQPVKTEEFVSEASTADTQLQQKREAITPSSKTSLEW
ncbi:ImpA family type VI secretion system protein [Vibrio aestuarianus]|uniref:type VI secretion system protein TssA n=1 Tax=Vibrio aestuarianus TaxID=28171 RepID=UPI0021C41A0B|nr:type VI secretion system ImpA family N-terminal domain-containing protein [Vibrio aestuarianus]MDE1211222.1 type VI secretion system ImpA family N-terminal domain-containing protein [Vibrio aestuarianus]MDE1254692.1 type VI secretion system ImpA family N-terminal domain-containing protein [Vibrio aestuarianus]MDE1319562.1 type VI secretion system ImpA family N-terminal domain-containing protein [Vibrio aestuarianus]CAH8242396.1 Type VI secretion protein [Vibrio aestuarianus]